MLVLPVLTEHPYLGWLFARTSGHVEIGVFTIRMVKYTPLAHRGQCDELQHEREGRICTRKEGLAQFSMERRHSEHEDWLAKLGLGMIE